MSKANDNSSISLKDKLSVFQAKCRQEGLKITPQRTAIYKTLLETTEHPSANTVFCKVREFFPNISFDTVNRSLLTLTQMGSAFIVEGSGGSKRFDAGMQAHQHFKCVKCKKIVDFHHKPFDDIPVPKELSNKYTISRKTVYFEGICDLCKKNED